MAHKKTQTSEQGKLVATLAYITHVGGVISLIWYLLDESIQKDAYANFHLKQAIVLWITSFIILLIAKTIPFIGGAIELLGTVIICILAILGILNALNNKLEKLPLIGEFERLLKF